MGTEPATRAGSAPSPDDEVDPLDRYADVTTCEGELLVYDVEEEGAWIQADRFRSLEACR